MSGGIYKFSDILKVLNIRPELKRGCIVDTSILFAFSYPNDTFNKVAVELFEYLGELKVPVFTNANIRAEFINNYFQVLVPEALNDFYQYPAIALPQELDKKLASNFTFLYEARKTGKSYKFSSGKVDEWKKIFRKNNIGDQDGWFSFCSSYVSHNLDGVWENTCDEAGINFLSLRGSDSKDWMTGQIDWKDMVKIVGNFGVGSFDAMIANLLLGSHFEGLITADIDLAKAVSRLSDGAKMIFVPDSINLQN